MRDFIETHSGLDLYLPDPDQNSIDIRDIAHALSNICRFSGHIDEFYSVGQHSIHVASLLPDELKLQGLLHDATEAYICDIPTPFKAMLPEYKALEDNLWYHISEKYGVPFELAPEVKFADRTMLVTERDYLKSNTKKNWDPKYQNHPRHEGWEPLNIRKSFVASLFLEKFKEYSELNTRHKHNT